MQFIHQPLTWCFFLVLVPLLIHLINLMRHRRVKWAAMDFLLQSYKKHRRWVWLRQLLLLLLRMAAIAAVVGMLAQLVTRDQWSGLFGAKSVHHFVLLDDSYSMSDRFQSTTMFDQAERAVANIAALAAGTEGQRNKMTLILFSRANRAPQPETATDPESEPGENAESTSQESREVAQVADLNAVSMDGDFDVLLEERRRSFVVTELAVGPEPALELVSQLVEQSEDEECIVYVVSDFRSIPWDAPEEARQLLTRLDEAGASVHFVRCVEDVRPNLGITNLQPAEGTLAAGVPLFVDFTIRNFSDEAAEQVQVKVRSIFHDAALSIAGTDPEGAATEELPTVLIDRIPPGESRTRRLQVYFPGPGKHIVQIELPDDAIKTDNRRWCVVDLPNGVPVLLVDGSTEQHNAYFLNLIFQPRTGIIPTVQTAAFLRDTSPDVLASYRAVYLLDVGRLDEQAVKNLEVYVRDGGGLCFFGGPNSEIPFYNSWYDDGEGLFPVKLDGQDVLIESLDETTDISVEDTPLFRVLIGERNPFLRAVQIDQFLSAANDWSPPENSTIRTIARLRNGRPLVVERQFGDGHVIVFLTSLSPQWNNWARQPSFVVVALELHALLDSGNAPRNPRLVGSPIQVQLDATRDRPDVDFLLPSAMASQRRRVRRAATVIGSSDDQPSTVLVATLGTTADAAANGETDRSGVYEAWSTRVDGDVDVRRYALNVDYLEGDLTVADFPQLTSKLNSLDVHFHSIDDISSASEGNAGFSWSQVFLYCLVGLLLGEQALAYSAGYHPPRGGRA